MTSLTCLCEAEGRPQGGPRVNERYVAIEYKYKQI